MRAQGEPRLMVWWDGRTAVTVEAIDAEWQVSGGLILPGHGIMPCALESGNCLDHIVPTGEVRGVLHHHQAMR